MTDWRPGAGRVALEARAGLFADIRSFFHDRGVLEVDTPLVASYGVTDPAIEPLRVSSGDAHPRFLQTSPEFAMKRLLAAGSGPMYQLGKAFRAGEVGPRHNPEFTLLEWYRPGFDLAALIAEVAALVEACLGRSGHAVHSYRELFLGHLGIDPLEADTALLRDYARARIDCGDLELDRDGWLDLLMSHCVEPALAAEGLVFVTDYPPSQAALARTVERDGALVGERFELYVDGLEIANGYRELLDADELARRAVADNRRRAAMGLEPQELDPRLLAAMRAGLPDCSGVALGVDRLLMRKLGASSLDEVQPFGWTRC
jgi:lysyl-tRNA synthetase class 2